MVTPDSRRLMTLFSQPADAELLRPRDWTVHVDEFHGLRVGSLWHNAWRLTVWKAASERLEEAGCLCETRESSVHSFAFSATLRLVSGLRTKQSRAAQFKGSESYHLMRFKGSALNSAR